MANFSFAVSGYNSTLAYSVNGKAYYAQIRTKELSYNYGVTSEESQSRNERAFYPHRRAQGQFRIVVDCVGYREFKQFMSWLQAYANQLDSDAASNAANVTLMDVQVPSRNFHKIGLLTSGVQDTDHVGAMVWNPELIFLTLSDPSDPSVTLASAAQGSTFNGPQVAADTSLSFYPASVSGYMSSPVYDDLSGSINMAIINNILTNSGKDSTQGLNSSTPAGVIGGINING